MKGFRNMEKMVEVFWIWVGVRIGMKLSIKLGFEVKIDVRSGYGKDLRQRLFGLNHSNNCSNSGWT